MASAGNSGKEHHVVEPDRVASPTSQERTPVPPVTRHEQAILALVLLLFGATLISLAGKVGVTVDEPAHLLSARLYWEGRDILRPGDMPPLLKITCGWVPLLLGAPLPRQSHPSWRTRDEWGLALAMMGLMDGPTIWKQFFVARLAMLVFPLGCCLLLWWWARQLFSPSAGLAVAAVFCLTPTVLAHGVLVKNDLAATFGYLLFWYRAWRFWQEPHPRNAVWLGLGAALALLAKYSMAILLPAAVVLIVLRFAGGGGRWMRPLARCLAATTLVVYLAILAGWQFRIGPIAQRDQEAWVQDPAIPRWFLGAVLLAATMPTPPAFWRGGVSLVANDHATEPYFLGQPVQGGHPLYFVTAIGLKLPLALLAMAAISTFLLWRRFRQDRFSARDWFWLLPGLLYLVLASASSLQLGLRLVLPAIAFLVLPLGLAFEEARHHRGVAVALVLLSVWLTGRTASAYPHYLGFFNQLTGSSWSGLRYLSDSNVDWGQDLPHLAEWYQRNQLPVRLRVAYFGSNNIWAYLNDQQVEQLPAPWSATFVQGRTRFDPAPGYYAISGTMLTGQLFPPLFRDYFAAFRAMEPIDSVGNSIFIFRVR